MTIYRSEGGRDAVRGFADERLVDWALAHTRRVGPSMPFGSPQGTQDDRSVAAPPDVAERFGVIMSPGHRPPQELAMEAVGYTDTFITDRALAAGQAPDGRAVSVKAAMRSRR